uniref:Leucine-rich repeat-containing protein DDB_G0290503-like n=1 Tax=Saccoglossus kowalevskii TaxID=10224 RepID=A0ABM0MKV9_SACKO|nr:PREDICTED: putative leucine-rich repeat-containing protein DDB_G0290503-like [Saccoglossus kowalevskii]
MASKTTIAKYTSSKDASDKSQQNNEEEEKLRSFLNEFNINENDNIHIKFNKSSISIHSSNVMKEMWLQCLKLAYPEEKHSYEDKKQEKTTQLRLTDKHGNTVTIKVYHNGTLLIQGNSYHTWMLNEGALFLMHIQDRLQIKVTTNLDQNKERRYPQRNIQKPLKYRLDSDSSEDEEIENKETKEREAVPQCEEDKEISNTDTTVSKKDHSTMIGCTPRNEKNKTIPKDDYTPSKIPLRISKTPKLNSATLDNTELAATLMQMFKSIEHIDKNYCNIMRTGNMSQELADQLKAVQDSLTRQNKEIQKICKLMATKVEVVKSAKQQTAMYTNKEDMDKLTNKLDKMERYIISIDKTVQLNKTSLVSVAVAQEVVLSKIQKYKDMCDNISQNTNLMKDELVKKEQEIERIQLENEELQNRIGEIEKSKLLDFHSPNLFNNLPLVNNNNKTLSQTALEIQDKYKLVDYRKKNREIQTLIVGDSMLKNIDIKRIYKNTQIKTLPGRKIKDIDEYIQRTTNENIQNIVIHVGTNNISDGCTIESCMEEYRKLINNMKQKYPTAKICVSSIIHRRYDVNINENIDVLNKKLKVMSNNGDNYIYIDNDNISYITHLYDTMHLNKRGTAVFVKNMKDVIGPLIGVTRQINKPGYSSQWKEKKNNRRYTPCYETDGHRPQTTY